MTTSAGGKKEAARALPDWVREHAEFAEEVSRLLNLGSKLRPPEKHTYRHVLQASVHESAARMAKATGTFPKGYVVPAEAEATATAGDAFTLAFNNGAALGMLRTHRYVVGVSLANALEAFATALEAQLLAPAFSQLRAALEHMGLAWATHRKLRGLEAPTDFKTANDFLGKALEVLNSALYGTRLNWKLLLASSSHDELLRDGKLEYQPETNRVDNTAKGLLGNLEKLDREVPGLENVYAVLCEVAHPNVGHLMFAVESAAPRPAPDENGVYWVDKTLARNPGGSVIGRLPNLFSSIVRISADAVEKLGAVRTEMNEVEARLLRATQMVIRHILKNKRDAVRERHAACPCGSGKKLWLCCAARH